MSIKIDIRGKPTELQREAIALIIGDMSHANMDMTDELQPFREIKVVTDSDEEYAIIHTIGLVVWGITN